MANPPNFIRSGTIPSDQLPEGFGPLDYGIDSAARRVSATATDAAGPPSLLAMAGNFVVAVAAHVADGGRKASPEVQAERKAICLACPLHDPAKDGCTKCACGMNPALSFVGLDLDLKRSWASSVCPDHPPRWAAV